MSSRQVLALGYRTADEGATHCAVVARAGVAAIAGGKALAEPVGLAERDWLDPHTEGAGVVITRYVDHSFPYRRLVSGAGFGARRKQMLDPKILDPRQTWPDAQAYDRQARELVDMFVENFAKFEPHVDADVKAAAPAARPAAE